MEKRELNEARNRLQKSSSMNSLNKTKSRFSKSNKEEEKYYGLNVSALNGEGHVGEHSGEEYFKVGGNANSDNTVLMVFDFVEKQKDLQFESIAVINRLIENCSGFKTIDDIPTV